MARLLVHIIGVYVVTRTLIAEAAAENEIHLSQGKISSQKLLQVPRKVPIRWYDQGNENAYIALLVTSSMLCGCLLLYWCKYMASRTSDSNNHQQPAVNGTRFALSRTRRHQEDDDDDPSLWKDHSELRDFSTSQFTYWAPSPLPLLVFVHGLGGCAAQFQPLLESTTKFASCLAIDLPGCGRSAFDAKLPWSAFNTDHLTDLLEQIINDYRDAEANQSVVLIGHSMGASLAARIAARDSIFNGPDEQRVAGVIAICPRATPPSAEATKAFRRLLLIPGPLLDLYRRWDRRGGTESTSVRRMVGHDADLKTKERQLRFNKMSRTPVFRRMAAGLLPTYEDGICQDGLSGEKTWTRLQCPVSLIAGEADITTKPEEVDKIVSFFIKSYEGFEHVEPVQSADGGKQYNFGFPNTTERSKTNPSSEYSEGEICPTNEELFGPPPARPRQSLKTIVLPAPASHALLYMPSTVQVLSHVVLDFLCNCISPRFSDRWQLQHPSREGK